MADLVSDVSDVRFLRQSGPHFSPSGRPKLIPIRTFTLARPSAGPRFGFPAWLGARGGPRPALKTPACHVALSRLSRLRLPRDDARFFNSAGNAAAAGAREHILRPGPWSRRWARRW